MKPNVCYGTKLYFGQRVIVDGDEIAVVIHAPKSCHPSAREALWVRLSDGVEQWRDPLNVKPLPNGEL